MLTINLSPFVELETPRLRLRAATIADAPTYFLMRSDPQLLAYTGRFPAKTMEEIHTFMQLVADNYAANTSMSWCIIDKNTGKMMGDIALWRIDAAHHRGELGYTLLADYHRQGYMYEALQAVLQYGFETLHLHTIEANIHPNNTASKALLQKSGFTKAAFYKENYYFDGRFEDTETYDMRGYEFLK
jgi:[ribosomal protein S5]-alanine N-acetyltransferase